MMVMQMGSSSAGKPYISPATGAGCQPVLRRPAPPANPKKPTDNLRNTPSSSFSPFTGDFSVTHHHPSSPRLTTTSPYNHLLPLFFPAAVAVSFRRQAKRGRDVVVIRSADSTRLESS
ncbi:hypothetical protein HanPI659440_Chr01g0003811 [Helianthus annuus]|nr:hypothetical protein HanHA300_Chr03g0103451 [Helianthus annuus]KAJ0609000.1 hypothetical protein HanHA89_Chr03g0115121 [Helianthus annuus]KAJ0769064.1 hypothetical protein HanLR1_Chr03g0108701 [Helianthus annuus]KAJ0808480.1 hypothetical protein HanPI659440_Chr01g0003811 [Helianthus annuus]KAJ0944798.1 hypothetical protein HanPSC8_Chr03g0120801 [Helianthus annuus]